jgi:hypothetical protein
VNVRSKKKSIGSSLDLQRGDATRWRDATNDGSLTLTPLKLRDLVAVRCSDDDLVNWTGNAPLARHDLGRTCLARAVKREGERRAASDRLRVLDQRSTPRHWIRSAALAGSCHDGERRSDGDTCKQ